MDETPAERQENEFQVLQAIYGPECVKDLREEDAWKVARPPHFILSLQPHESTTPDQDVHCSVDLKVKFLTTYPDAAPELSLENGKGLSDRLLAMLQEELNKMASKLLGEVMILDLAQHVQSFLHANNHPPSRSFYDEMMVNKRIQEEKIALQQQKKMDIMKKKEEKQLKQIEEEIQKRQDAVREEARRLRTEAKLAGQRNSMSEPSTPLTETVVSPICKDTEQLRRSRASASPESHTPGRTPAGRDRSSSNSTRNKSERRRRTSTPRSEEDGLDDSDRSCQNHRGTVTLTFKKDRTINRGCCIGHSIRGSTVYAGMDTSTGELVAVIEWVLRWRQTSRKLNVEEKKEDEEQTMNYFKQVVGIEQEVASLVKLRHPSIVHYYGINYTKEYGKISVYILCEHISGGTLATSLKEGLPTAMEVLRRYTVQLLEALTYLHGKAVVHKDLRPTSVLLDPQGHVRLTDYSLDRRIADLWLSVEASRPGVKFAPEHIPTIGRVGKKGDISRLGLLVLSLALGETQTDTAVEVPKHLPKELQDFLEKCLTRDEQARWSARQLQDHSFVKCPILTTVTNHKTQNGGPHHKGQGDGSSSEGDNQDESYIPFIPTCESSHSRLKNEFEILKWIGKGGFGDVIKVRNKLDGRFYAIKRIPLNTRSKQFTKKITREVKLLSRLNHENVVRYYNSWIEISDEPAPNDSSSTYTGSTSQSDAQNLSSEPKMPVSIERKNSLGIRDSVEFSMPPPEDSTEWSVSVSGHAEAADVDSSSSSLEEDDENDVFGASFLPCSDSESDDGIVFGDKSSFDDWAETEDSKIEAKPEGNEMKADVSGSEEVHPRLQLLYIQMEFCEKSTLRTCIDDGLYLDRDRVARFFREIVEGLVHIHEQGMIHRDLKPVNIFLDSNDHVKIGDFGLATTGNINQVSTIDMSMSASSDMKGNISHSDSLGDGNLTGKVGSALYVSPEMLITSSRTYYNQKVDIYSLGVMYFEMVYHPLTTGMERIKVLTNLRLPTIDFPEDFDEVEFSKQAELIRWLLNHDASKRPTAQELLQSDLVPPAQMEEAELNELLRSTIANPESKSFRHMVHTLLHQPIDVATDYTYDIDLQKSRTADGAVAVQMQVMATVESIFLRHSAVKIATPIFMPKSSLYEHTDLYVSLLDHSGSVVSLPYDLRVPFARYVGRNSINHIKRYNIERVFRERKIVGLHPRELTECAFDIVTNTPTSGLPEAELVQIVQEVINEYPSLQSRNYYLQLNHVHLLKAVLLHCGVPEDLHQHVFTILSENKMEKQGKLQLQTRLCSLSLSDQTVVNLYHFIETEGSFGKISSMLRCITKTRGQAAMMAKKGLKDLEEIVGHLSTLGSKLEPHLALGLVYNVHMFCGCIFQVAANVRRKKKQVLEVLAAGGRYDDLLHKFQHGKTKEGGNVIPALAAGVSISLERLVTGITESEEFHVRSPCDVLLCSIGQKPMIKEKLLMTKQLWAAGIHCDIFQDCTQTVNDIYEYCRKMHIPQMLTLKDMEPDTARVRIVDKEVAEKKFYKYSSNMSVLIEYLKLMAVLNKSESSEQSASSSSMKAPLSSQSSCESTTSSGHSHIHGGNSPLYNIVYIFADNSKLAMNAKRRYESQIRNTISSPLAHISGKASVEVIGLDLPAAVLKTISGCVEVHGDEQTFESSLGEVFERHARYKKYLTKLFDTIHEFKFEKKSSVIVLYALNDNTYRILHL